MQKTNWKVTTGDFVFGATIRKPEKLFSSDNQQYMIEFGGTAKCIDITVYKNDEKAWLTGLKHDELCAVNKPLATGDEGTVVMVKAAVAFVKFKFPFVTHFEFLDTSHIDCKKKTQLSLAYFHFAKHGNTWYGSKFDAKPCVVGMDIQMRDLNKWMDSVSEKQKYSFAKFRAEHLELEIEHAYKDFKRADAMKTKLFEVIRPVFDETRTFREFITTLDTRIPKNCIVFYGWLEPFLNNIGNVNFHDTHWAFSSDLPELPRMKIEKIKENLMRPTTRPQFDWMSTIPSNTMTGGKRFRLPF